MNKLSDWAAKPPLVLAAGLTAAIALMALLPPGLATTPLALLPLVAAFLWQQSVGARVLANARAKTEAAEDASRNKTEVLGHISHELRTPLNGIIGVGQLLSTQPLDAEGHEMLGVLMSAARQQLELVNDLLDVTRIETGELNLKSLPFKPVTPLQSVVALSAPEARGKDIELTFEHDADTGITLLGDEHAFRQIVTNLMGNALKFTSAGSVSVRLIVEPWDRSARLRVMVTDTGQGIPPSSLDTIFERFAQIEGNGSDRRRSTGLGLPITRAIAEAMGGTVTVQSVLGVGSTFTLDVALPMAADTEAPIAGAA